MAIQIVANTDTWLKKSPAQASELPNNEKSFVNKGKTYYFDKATPDSNGHLKVELSYDAGTWWIFTGHWSIESEQQSINQAGLKLIEEFEGTVLNAYQCSSRVWTIGVGTTIYPNGRRVQPGDIITQQQAMDYLHHDIIKFENIVRSRVDVSLTDNQFSALVSLVYNCGSAPLWKGKTIARALARRDYQAAADGFLLWNRAGGRVLSGLVRRRKAERALFLS